MVARLVTRHFPAGPGPGAGAGSARSSSPARPAVHPADPVRTGRPPAEAPEAGVGWQLASDGCCP